MKYDINMAKYIKENTQLRICKTNKNSTIENGA